MWVHLDTHVVVHLASGHTHLIPEISQRRIARARPLVTPMVLMELAYLYQIKRISQRPTEMREFLREKIDLGIAESSFERTALVASAITWTRDPFDRLIAAHAMADDVPLITSDRKMREHCPVAVWDA